MIKKIFLSLVLFVSFASTMLANDVTNTSGLGGVINKGNTLLTSAYGLILSAIGIAFAWGVLKFVFKTGDDREEGKAMMIWSIVAMTVLASVYGIVNIFKETLGANNNTGSELFPTLPTGQTATTK